MRGDERRTVILLSGGIDSACLIPFLAPAHGPLDCLFVDYGQPSAEREHAAASRIATHFNVSLSTRAVTAAKRKGPGMIAGRNAFLLLLALMEVPVSRSLIAIGIHSGTEYVDCSADFLGRMQGLADLYCHGTVRFLAPFVSWTKRDIWSYARTRIPLHETYSCELGLGQPCGRCLSCSDLEALNAGS